MKINYGRVSTPLRDQHPEAQHYSLTPTGCERVFVDKLQQLNPAWVQKVNTL